MRPFTSTISLTEARRRLDDTAHPIERRERVPLADAAGCVCAAPVASPVDVPPFARSAMDGYAVVAADTAGATRDAPVLLDLGERIYTGAMPVRPVVAGTCAEIATGAPIPDGADAVVMVEQTAVVGGRIAIRTAAHAGQNVGRQGTDIERGASVVRPGDWLTPGRVGALAAIGAPDVEVYARPRVAIFSTGNEVIEPGGTLAPGQLFDVNRSTLGSIVAMHGGVPVPRPPAGDTLEALGSALDACGDVDLIVCSGGSSVGEKDLIIDLLRQRGDVVFHGIAVKPGKPTAFGRIGRAAFFGMPGNPTSCLSNAYILLIPFLRAIARLPPHTPRVVTLPLGRAIASTSDRHEFHTVRIDRGVAMPAFKGSGQITSLSEADGYIEIDPETMRVEAGTPVDVKLF